MLRICAQLRPLKDVKREFVSSWFVSVSANSLRSSDDVPDASEDVVASSQATDSPKKWPGLPRGLNPKTLPAHPTSL